MTRIFVLAITLFIGAGTQAVHADATCQSTAAEKKLSGAARTSFLKKCESDAQAKCDATAADRKLSGAAKTSFSKKCVTDAVGA